MGKGAFTLVELSIVLVILGLLVGGVLAGQNLIRAAELRSVLTEQRNYITAITVFREKYFAIPGDMGNATDFWGAMTNCGAASPSGSGTQTCNGDGDGRIDSSGAGSQTIEMYGFWQHLANGGFIEGTYTGIAGASNASQHIAGENTAASRVEGATWGVRNFGSYGSATTFEYNYGNHMTFGKIQSSGTGLPIDPVLRTEEAWNLDTKFDDGKPGLGALIAYTIPACTLASGQTDYAADYNLATTSLACALYFKDAF